jgi:drug/metabolite transporter (DMT)-like permease
MMWLVFAGISALLSAASAVIQKKILFRLSALEFSFGVSAVVLLFSLAVQAAAGLPVPPLPVIAVIAGKSVLGAAAFLLVMTALERNQISAALPLLGLTPAAAALLSVPVLGESLGIREYAALALMFTGTYLIERQPSRNAGRSAASAPGMVYFNAPIVGALVLFAVSSVVDKKLVGGMKVDPSVVLVYQHCVYFCIFGSMTALRISGTRAPVVVLRNLAQLLRKQLPAITLAAVLTLGYRFAQLEAAKDAPIALVLAVKRTSILFASLYGGRIFADERLGVRLAGAALIVAAGFLILRFSI